MWFLLHQAFHFGQPDLFGNIFTFWRIPFVLWLLEFSSFFIHDLLKLSNTQDKREVRQLFHFIKLFHHSYASTLALDSSRIKSWMNSGCGGCLFMWWPNRNGYSQVLWKPHSPTHDHCRLWKMKPNNLKNLEKLGKSWETIQQDHHLLSSAKVTSLCLQGHLIIFD